jgi:hypothetical protein
MRRDGLSDHELMRKREKVPSVGTLGSKVPDAPNWARERRWVRPLKINVWRQGAAANGIPVGGRFRVPDRGMEPAKTP